MSSRRLAAALAALALPGAAAAHGFGRLYNLPVPFWLYGWGAAAALVLSFLLAIWFVDGGATRPAAPRELSPTLQRALCRVRAPLQWLGVLLLLTVTALTIIRFEGFTPERSRPPR